jgi:PleD family two-component response regulator
MTDLIRIHQALKKRTRKTRSRAEVQAAIARVESSRILLVDRNQHGLAARKALLEELGYDVTVTTGSIDALAAVSEGKILFSSPDTLWHR